MLGIYKQIGKAAPTDATVLIKEKAEQARAYNVRSIGTASAQ